MDGKNQKSLASTVPQIWIGLNKDATECGKTFWGWHLKA